MIRSIPYSLPLENGKFRFVSGTERIELSMDFVIMFHDRIREYKDYFSTLFLYSMLQQPASFLIATATLLKNRLTNLLTNSIPFLRITASSLSPTSDRKVFEFLLDYRYEGEDSEEVKADNYLYARFIER